MSARRDEEDRGGARPALDAGGGAASSDLGRTALLVLLVVAMLAAVVYPLRRYVVEPRRQELLGRVEPPGRRLALVSQFGFASVTGTSVRVVPGSPSLELGDLPTQALTVILGGFRGPYVVWLWVKSEEEKQRKIHFDLIDRYTRIAALQSDYPQMWTFHSWNIAWNVSVQWQSLERKYQWVRRATDFLGEGHRKNPHSAEIMAEMGRIYSEKFGRAQEAPYYRQRVQEDEGRSPFLIAYEWYDRARKANDRYGTLGRGLGKPVIYSQACHNISYYAQQLTQEAYDAFKESLDLRTAGKAPEARAAADRGFKRLADAVRAWEWARREWLDQAVRFEKEGVGATLNEIYRRFYKEADESCTQLQALQREMTPENLPEVFPKMRRPEIG